MLITLQSATPENSANGYLVDSKGALRNNPFHKGILGIQTTNPNQPFTVTISWKGMLLKITNFALRFFHLLLGGWCPTQPYTRQLHPRKRTAKYPKWWFGNGDCFQIWPSLVSMLNFWGVLETWKMLRTLGGLNGRDDPIRCQDPRDTLT